MCDQKTRPADLFLKPIQFDTYNFFIFQYIYINSATVIIMVEDYVVVQMPPHDHRHTQIILLIFHLD